MGRSESKYGCIAEKNLIKRQDVEREALIVECWFYHYVDAEKSQTPEDSSRRKGRGNFVFR
jgi:hypothetical protein